MPVLQAQELAGALGGPLLVSKGRVDVLTDGTRSLVVTADGSPRRCGGQGDVLTGGCRDWKQTVCSEHKWGVGLQLAQAVGGSDVLPGGWRWKRDCVQ